MDFKRDQELAEISGFHAGDGYLRNDGKRIELDLSGNIEEREFYDNIIIPLFSKYFDIKIKGRYFNSRGTYGFVIRDKPIVSFMNSLGFPYGKKSSIVKAPKFIFKSVGNMTAFLRGYFDADGCFCPDRKYDSRYIEFKRKYHYYPRINMSTCSKKLLEDLSYFLDILGINFHVQIFDSKIITESTKYVIWVVGNKNVEKWFNIIGSRNSSKMTKYLIWKKFGFCPPNTTLEQRKQILKNDLDPKIFYGPVAQPGRSARLRLL